MWKSKVIPLRILITLLCLKRCKGWALLRFVDVWIYHESMKRIWALPLTVIQSSGVSAIQRLLKYWSEWKDSRDFHNCPVLLPILFTCAHHVHVCVVALVEIWMPYSPHISLHGTCRCSTASCSSLHYWQPPTCSAPSTELHMHGTPYPSPSSNLQSSRGHPPTTIPGLHIFNRCAAAIPTAQHGTARHWRHPTGWASSHPP